jgi:hypothetical protein
MKKVMSLITGVLVFIVLFPLFAVGSCNGACHIQERSGLSGITYPGSWPEQVPMLIAAVAGMAVALILWRTWARK